jgi:hypothetical protein
MTQGSAPAIAGDDILTDIDRLEGLHRSLTPLARG